MTAKELKNNMVIGCKDPDDQREEKDLGRFGSGMKTASFSQARQLTYPVPGTQEHKDYRT